MDENFEFLTQWRPGKTPLNWAERSEALRYGVWKREQDKIKAERKRLKKEKSKSHRRARQKAAKASAKARRKTAKKYKPWSRSAQKITKNVSRKLPSAKWRGQIAKRITYKIHKAPTGKNKLRASFQSQGYRYNVKTGKRIRERYKPHTRTAYKYATRRVVGIENGKPKLTSIRHNQWVSSGSKIGGELTGKQWVVHLSIAAHSMGINVQNFKMIHAMRAQQVFMEAFVKQGFDNKKWQPLADSTIKKRSRSIPSRPWGVTWPGRILADSGTLFNSIKITNGPGGSVRIQASAPYAGIHNNPTDGMTYGKSKRHVIQRQFMGHSTAIEKFIALNIDKYLFDDVFVSAAK